MRIVPPVRIVILPRAIRLELARVAADDFTVHNLHDGYVALVREAGEPPIRWVGPARPLLDRLLQLPDRAGSQAVTSALPAQGRQV